MSKHFGGGRRLEDKVYPRRTVEDKRPSVFDRLGVREYDDPPPPSHSHYGTGGSDRGGGGGYRRMDGGSSGGMRKHSPPQMNPMMSGNPRRNPDVRERIRSRSRSRSFSPRSRKVPPEIPHHSHMGGHGHGHMKKMKASKEISPHDNRLRLRSNSPVRRKGDKPLSTRSPSWKDPNTSHSHSHPRHKTGGERSKSKKGSGKRSGKKSGKPMGEKGRSSSASSASSGETSSSSRSASSSSSSSEGSSSSTSNASSSSDSSVPSIKLKHDKQKRKKPKRPSSKSESVSTGQIQSRISSGSSIESGNVRDNRDLREKIKAKTRQNYEKMHDGTPSDMRQKRPHDQYGGGGRSHGKHQLDMREHTPGGVDGRRRRPSGASSSYDDVPSKRRRVMSSEDYVPSPRRAPPPNDPPPGVQPNRRDRSPMSRDRMRAIQSPMRRAPLEDRRNDPRGDMGKRLDNYPDNKHRDMDRYNEDGGSYGRDNMLRPKDRMAPARVPPPMRMHQHPGPGSGNLEHDRERGPMTSTPNSGQRFDTRHRPLLQMSQGPGSGPPDHSKHPYRGPSEDRLSRNPLHSQSPSPAQKHSPMIVKSKEALIEKYRGMKQSQYVDMWVDKTVEACAGPPGNSSSILSPPAKDMTLDSTSSVETPQTKPAMADIGELLSDFSDDDAELLNDMGDDPPMSEKSEINNSTLEKDKNSTAAGDNETEIVSSATAETSAVAQTESPTKISTTPLNVSTPNASLQDRKSMGTPQRSFLELSGREGQSLPSRSQTEDDILERMDFEEISDEELGDVAGENKIPIVDALGVDWASLVCGEKNRPVSPSSVRSNSSSSLLKVRKRWTPLHVISRVGVISNCSERLLQNIVQMKMNEENLTENSPENEEDQSEIEEKIIDELQNAGKLRKRRARANVIDTIGLGPNSRALSSRRDMALRRYYLGMPQKSLVSMDMLHQNSATNSVQDLESIGELYRLSLSLFKGTETATVNV